MSKFIINGERQLSGELNILGAKNSVLPLLAAAILTDEKVVLHNCPDISDVHNMLAILQSLGSVTTFDKGDITIDSSNINNEVVPSKLAHATTCTVYFCTHTIQKVLQIHNFRFSCNIAQSYNAIGKHACHHQIFCGTYGWNVKNYFCC